MLPIYTRVEHIFQSHGELLSSCSIAFVTSRARLLRFSSVMSLPLAGPVKARPQSMLLPPNSQTLSPGSFLHAELQTDGVGYPIVRDGRGPYPCLLRVLQ